MKIRVYFEDTDCGGIVYHANYIKFCERARSELFFSTKENIFGIDNHFVVTNINAKFIKSAVGGDLLEIKTYANKIKQTSAILKQDIYKIGDCQGNEYNELIFSAYITIAYLENKKPTKIQETAKRLLNSLKKAI